MFIWQTKDWWDMLQSSNQVEKIFELDSVIIEKRKVSFWEYWLFVLWIEPKIINKKIEEKLIFLCKKEKCLFIQLETLDYNDCKVEEKISLFKTWYYKKFIPPFTVIIDLNKSEEDILSEMKPKWRYNIKLATKKWIECKIVEKTKENISVFYNLVLETTKRDSFSWNTLEYYKIFLEKLDSSSLIFAYKDNKVIASGIFIFEKELSIYYYWASSSEAEYRNLMAPYLLQWTAIKEAKAKGSQIYDFLWIATPWDDNSSLKWVTDFKFKFNKTPNEVSKSHIYINKNIKYSLIILLKRLFKKT